MTVRVTKNGIALFVMHIFVEHSNAKVVSVHMTNAPMLLNTLFVQILTRIHLYALQNKIMTNI